MLHSKLSLAGLLVIVSLLVGGCGAAPQGAATPSNSSPGTTPAAGATTAAVEAPAASAATSNKPITLNVWLYPYWSGVTGTEDPAKSTPADVWKFMADEFKKTHPNVSFNFEVLDWSTGRQKVNIAISSKSTPDILANEDGPVMMRYARLGVLQPIDDALTPEDKADFKPSVLESVTYQGHIMVWPWSQTGAFWVANKKIFEERNAVDLLPKNAEHSWNFDDFLKAAKATTFSRSGGTEPDVYGVCMGFKEGPGDYNRLGFIWGKGGRLYNNDFTKMAVNSPEAIAGLQYIQDLDYKDKVMMPGSAGLSDDDCSKAFYEGKVAMMGATSSNSEAQIANDEKAGTIKPGTVEYYGILPPADPGKEPGVDAPPVTHGVFLQSDPDKLKAAMEFLHLVTDKDHMKLVKPSGNAAVRISVGNLYPDSPLATWWQGVVKYAAPDQNNPYNKDLRAVTVPMFQEVMTRSKTPKEAVEEAEQKGNELIKKLEAQSKQ